MRTVDFTEEELVGDDSIIRLASECYSACRICSEQLEGNNIDTKSLAVFRCSEAREHLRMWCANNGIVPAFDIVPEEGATTEVGANFAYAIGQDTECI